MRSTVWRGIFSLGLLLIVPSGSSWMLSPEDGATPASAIQGSIQGSMTDRLIDRGAVLVAQCGRGRLGRARGPEDALIPYVISPRNTAVLSDRPDLRWNPIAGVDRYQVSLKNGEEVIWTQEVNTSRIAYPAAVAALQPGIHYGLEVQAANGRASTEEDTQPLFYLLAADQVESVRQTESLLTGSFAAADRGQAAIIQANFYAGSELESRAIEVLEAAVTDGVRSAQVYRQLGDLYARSNLNIRAEPYYLEALPLAAGDLAEVARVQLALGELYGTIDQAELAIEWLTRAKESYGKLDDRGKVKEVEELLIDATFTDTGE